VTIGMPSAQSLRGPSCLLSTALALLLPAAVLAQVQPDAGRILQETRPVERAPVVTVPPIQAPAAPRPAVPAVGGDVRVQVTHFEFTGNNALSADTLRAAVATWGLGWVLDHKGWGWYFPYLVPFGLVGSIMMFSIAHRKSLKKDASAR